MRLLYLSHCLPSPPNKGDKIRAHHELRALAEHHEIDLFALADERDLSPGDDLNEICRRVEVFRFNRTLSYARGVLGAAAGKPLTLGFFRSGALERRLRQLRQTERYDAVIAYSSSMAPYALAFEGTPRVLDLVDIDSAKWAKYAERTPRPMRWVYEFEAQRLRAYERSLAERFDRLIVTTAGELELLHEIAPAAPGVAVRNGIDDEFFSRLDYPRSEHPLLVFTGQMDYFPNVDGIAHFAREIFPRLRAEVEGLELIIVGRSPVPQVTELHETVPGVTVTGAVGDVRPFLSRAWAFVAPLRIAQGVQNKVLEAMSSELPVICSKTVMDGLADGGIDRGRDIGVADTADEWCRAVRTLVDDAPGAWQRAVENRERLIAGYSWDRNMAVLETLLDDVTSKPLVALDSGPDRSLRLGSPGDSPAEPQAGPPTRPPEASYGRP